MRLSFSDNAEPKTYEKRLEYEICKFIIFFLWWGETISLLTAAANYPIILALNDR
jgi:hypothetical protein